MVLFLCLFFTEEVELKSFVASISKCLLLKQACILMISSLLFLVLMFWRLIRILFMVSSLDSDNGSQFTTLFLQEAKKVTNGIKIFFAFWMLAWNINFDFILILNQNFRLTLILYIPHYIVRKRNHMIQQIASKLHNYFISKLRTHFSIDS